MSQIKTDFRLTTFLDVLTNKVQELTLAEKTIQQLSLVIKSELEKQLQQFDAKIDEHERALRLFDSWIQQSSEAEVKCDELRKHCHEEVDKFFDSTKRHIKESTATSRFGMQCKQQMAKTELSELGSRKQAVVTMIAAYNTTLTTDGLALIGTAKSYLESLKTPNVEAVQVPRITLEMNKSWKASDAIVITKSTVKLQQVCSHVDLFYINDLCCTLTAPIQERFWLFCMSSD